VKIVLLDEAQRRFEARAISSKFIRSGVHIESVGRRCRLVDLYALDGRVVRDRIVGPPIVFELAGSAEEHVGPDAGSLLHLPHGHRIVEAGRCEVVGDDHEEVPVAVGHGRATRAAAE